MAKKDFKVEVTVKEITTKTTVIPITASHQTKACGAAEYAVENEPEACEFSEPTKTLQVISSRIVVDDPNDGSDGKPPTE